MKGTISCIIPLMATDEYVVWQQLKEIVEKQSASNKRKTIFKLLFPTTAIT